MRHNAWTPNFKTKSKSNNALHILSMDSMSIVNRILGLWQWICKERQSDLSYRRAGCTSQNISYILAFLNIHLKLDRKSGFYQKIYRWNTKLESAGRYEPTKWSNWKLLRWLICERICFIFLSKLDARPDQRLSREQNPSSRN